MTGVEKLVIERNGYIEFSATAHTSKVKTETKWHLDNPFMPFTPGLIDIPLAIVNNDGIMKVKLTPVKALLNIADLTIKKGNCT